VERLIGTLRREYLDRILFWTTADLENKLLDFTTYFNNHRTHTSLEGRTPDTPVSRPLANLAHFDGNLTVVTYIRHQWLRNFPKTLDRCVSGQPSGNLQLNHLVFAFLVAGALRGSDCFSSTVSIRQRHVEKASSLADSDLAKVEKIQAANDALTQYRFATTADCFTLGPCSGNLDCLSGGFGGLGNFADLDKLTRSSDAKVLVQCGGCPVDRRSRRWGVGFYAQTHHDFHGLNGCDLTEGKRLDALESHKCAAVLQSHTVTKSSNGQ